jgi:hypothetical protein
MTETKRLEPLANLLHRAAKLPSMGAREDASIPLFQRGRELPPHLNGKLSRCCQVRDRSGFLFVSHT